MSYIKEKRRVLDIAVVIVLIFALAAVAAVSLFAIDGVKARIGGGQDVLVECVNENKLLAVTISRDTTIPYRERELRVAFTKARMKTCADKLGRK